MLSHESPTKKRLRSNESSSPVSGKKACPTTSGGKPSTKISYKDAASPHLRVAIIDQSNHLGQLTAEQVELVQNSLSRKLDEVILAPSSSGQHPAPTFRSWNHSGGILRITCEDESSRTWLGKAVRQLEPLWEGCLLNMVQVDQLPRLAKVSFWIPGVPDDRELVLARLTAQNPWANVKNWRVFHDASKEEPLGRLLVVGVEEAVSKIIVSKGSRLHYRFSTLKVKVKFNKNNSEDPAPGKGPRNTTTADEGSDFDLEAELRDLQSLNIDSEETTKVEASEKTNQS